MQGMRADKPKIGVPNFTVQIVHIEGPRSGQMDELNKERISVGRSPDSDVCFPKDLRIISRRHAEILNLGGRFLLKNLSKNGCFVNGKPAQVKYLQQGDIFTFAEGGPKARFQFVPQAGAPAKFSSATQRPAGAGRASARFTIQFGIHIKSLQQTDVSLGSAADSDFVLSHPRVLPKHAQVYVQAGKYYLRDLSQAQATLLNGRPLLKEAPLQSKDVIGFGKGGPQLQYLGAGCLAEMRAQPLLRNRKILPPGAR
jgi:pSer/pThr/pTyr-binding forkhead associated (FHA) protein